MMKKRVLVLASNGMLGHTVAIMLRDRFDITTAARSAEPLKPDVTIDFRNADALRNLVASVKPDVIINCAGVLNQVTEIDPGSAILINSYLPHLLAKITKDTPCKIIHVSTDCVFSGKRGGYLENDLKDGRDFYSQSKSLGEICNNKDLTLRTSLIGPELKTSGIGLFQWFSKQEGQIKGYTEVFWTGVTSIEMSKAIIAAIEQDLTGLYHLVNGEKISKYGLLELFKKVFQGYGVTEIIPSLDKKYDKSLVNTRNDFNYKVPSYEAMVTEMKEWIGAHRDIYAHYIKQVS